MRKSNVVNILLQYKLNLCYPSFESLEPPLSSNSFTIKTLHFIVLYKDQLKSKQTE